MFQLARADGLDDRGALDQLVSRGGEEDAARLCAHPMSGAAHALQRSRDAARRADLYSQVHRADVDAELKRCGRDHGFQLAILEARLGVLTQRARQTSVVRQDHVRAQARAQRVGDPLRHAARVDEHQRGAFFTDVARQAIVNLLPHFAGRDRAQFVVRHFHRKRHFATMPHVDDGRAWRNISGYVFDRPDRRGKPDALRMGYVCERFQTRQRERQV